MSSILDLKTKIDMSVEPDYKLPENEEFKIAWQAYILKNIHNDDEDDEIDYKEFEQELESDFESVNITTKPKLVNTPYGLIDVSNEANPYLNYEAWIMHTKFTLTPKRIMDIANIPGIEVVKPISRYRLFLAFGKLFTFTEIRKSINDLFNINSNISMKNVEVQLEKIKYELSNTYKHWVICVFPNGNIQHAFSESLEPNDDFKNKVVSFETCKQECPDIILLKSES